MLNPSERERGVGEQGGRGEGEKDSLGQAGLRTEWVRLAVSLRDEAGRRLRSDEVRSHIETALSNHGIPLRWALTDIDLKTHQANVEAIVTLQA